MVGQVKCQTHARGPADWCWLCNGLDAHSGCSQRSVNIQYGEHPASKAHQAALVQACDTREKTASSAQWRQDGSAVMHTVQSKKGGGEGAAL